MKNKTSLILIPLLLIGFHCFSLQCPNCKEEFEIQAAPKYEYIKKDASWWCEGCGLHVWSDSPDMWGDYYCPSCGTQK